MMLPDSDRVRKTSSCPVRARQQSFEQWPHPVFQLFAARLRTLPEGLRSGASEWTVNWRDPFPVAHADRDSLPSEGREQRRSSVHARRRTLICLLAGLSLGARAQSTQKVPRIGVVAPLSPPPAASPDIDGFRRGLSELGYVEGRNILLEYRWALGRQDASSRYAEELARLDLDVIVVAGPISALSAKRLTRRPIIFAAAGVDPVSIGLVESLARPGGNATGLAMLNEEITGKRFELIKETVPGIARVGVLVAPGDPRYTDLMVKAVEQAARTAAIHVQLLRLGEVHDLDAAFKQAAVQRLGAVIATQSPFFANENARITHLGIMHRMPVMSGEPSFPESGGLMTYGPNVPDLWRRAASYVDKVLKGESPATLPVEQPTKFDLLINLKTAKRLGLTIPESLLIRADKVIS